MFVGLRVGVPGQKQAPTSVNPYAAFNAVVQGLYTSTAATGLWYDGTDATQRTVNSDGTGGVPASGAKFGRLIDKTGGGRHAVQATSASQPIAQSGFVLFQHKEAVTPGDPRRFLTPASNTGTSMQASTGVVICDVQHLPFDALPCTGWFYSNANTGFPCKKAWVAWRTNNSGSLDLYVCDINYNSTPSGAMSSGANRAPIIGIGSGIPDSAMQFYQYVQFDVRLSDANFLALRNAAAAASGSATFNNDVVVFAGDSNTEGFRIDNAQTYPYHFAAQVNAKVYNRGITAVPMANLNANINGGWLEVHAGSGVNTLAVLAATNDVTPSNYSDFAQLDGAMAYRARQTNWRVIGATYMPINASCQAFNGALRANAIGDWFDILADIEAVSQVSNPADTTYYQSDVLHLKSAAEPFVAAAFLSAYTTLMARPWAKFTATPINGTSVNAAFTNASVGASSYAWDFENNGSTDSTATNPTNNYTVAANYAPKLTATAAGGSSTRIRPFYINVLGSLTPVTSGLVGRFMQNTGITDVANAVSAWADQSGSGNNLVQATGANQPTKQGDGTISFDGTNDFMANTVAGLDYKSNVMMRVRINTYTSGRVLCDGIVNNSGFIALLASPNIALYQTPGSIIAQSIGGTTGSYITILMGTLDAAATPRMQTFKVGGQDRLMGAWGGFVSAAGLTVGARYDGSTPSAITLKEVLHYNRAMTQAEIAQNEAYLDSL